MHELIELPFGMFLKSIYLFVFLIIVLERIIFTFISCKESEGEIKYKRLTSLLIFTYTLCTFIALSEFIIQNIIQEKNINLYFTSIGFLFYLFGITLRRFAIKTLGSNWSVHTKIIKDQKLIRNGPYKYIRHPYYLAVMLELIGISIFYNSIIATIVTLCVQLPLLLFRIPLEEKMLNAQFGEKYKHFKKVTNKIFPHILLF